MDETGISKTIDNKNTILMGERDELSKIAGQKERFTFILECGIESFTLSFYGHLYIKIISLIYIILEPSEISLRTLINSV